MQESQVVNPMFTQPSAIGDREDDDDDDDYDIFAHSEKQRKAKEIMVEDATGAQSHAGADYDDFFNTDNL